MDEYKAYLKIPVPLVKLKRGLFPYNTRRMRLLYSLLGALCGFKPGDNFVAARSCGTVKTSHISRSVAHVRSILLIKADHIGDFIICLPSLKLIRDTFPEANITLLCGSWNQNIAKASSLVDQIIPISLFPEHSQHASNKSVLSVVDIKMLSSLPDYDIAIDLKVEGESRSILGHIHATYKAGYVSPVAPSDMSLILAYPAPSAFWGEPEREHHTAQLLYMLASGVVSDFTRAQITHDIMSSITKLGKTAIQASKSPIIGIHTGAGVQTKKWPLLYYSELVECLMQEFGATVVLFGTKNEFSDAQVVMAKNSEKGLFVNMVDKISFADFMASANHLDMYIGNDTGSTHAASALGVPVLCIYSGASLLGRFTPMGKNTVVIHHEMPCAPCGLKDTSDCRHRMACLTKITVEHVMQECRKILGPREKNQLSKSNENVSLRGMPISRNA